MIQFLLNREVVSLPESMATITVLDYLRNQKGRSGTKEGCATGDCGACTVVLAEVTDQGLDYRAINSCITLVGALQGRQLITVEDLADDQNLHPVQQAMVDHHGSQCGFCTPGFVMALFALYKNSHHSKQADDYTDPFQQRQQVLRGLAGNLCRCTGYRPIIDAALSCFDDRGMDQFIAREPDAVNMLQSINQTVLDACWRPTSTAQLAAEYLAYPDARLVAGTTDLALEITQQLQTPGRAIFVNQIDELRIIERSGSKLVVGAAASLNAFNDAVSVYFPAISQLLERFGSPQIRNQATIGGNLATASPIGDLPPVLLALGAVLVLRKGESTRTIAVDGFFTDYRKTILEKSEFIQSIHLPLLADNQVLRIYKVSKRRDDDISAVCLAICMTLNVDHDTKDNYRDAVIEHMRIAAGGMAAAPSRAFNCETAFVGHRFTADTISQAQLAIEQDFEPISDVRASAAYRIRVTQNLLQRFFLDLTGSEFKLRVEDAA